MAESGTYTLSELRTLSKQRATMQNSNFVVTSEWNNYINDSLKELYDILIQKYGDDYAVESVDFTTDGSAITYALPNGTNYSAASPFYKLLGLDLALSNNQTDSWVTIRPFMFADRNKYAVPNFQSFYGVTNLRYRLQGNNLWLTPTPMAGQLMRLWYVPRLATLVDDTDVADGYGGWLEYVIIDAAIKAVVKANRDVSALEGQKSQMLQRLTSVAENRDAGNPAIVTDVQFQNAFWPTGSGSDSGSWGGF